MWYHGAGNKVEVKIINQISADFNASPSDWKVELQSFPQAADNDQSGSGLIASEIRGLSRRSNAISDVGASVKT